MALGAPLAPLALVAAVLIGVLAGPVAGLGLAAPHSEPASAFRTALDGAAARGRVLVAFDPDIGTYAEVRPAVRAAFAHLVAHGASLSVVSFSAEGRALAIAELDRLATGGVEATRLLDLGFRAGAEAGLVGAVHDVIPPGRSGALAEALRAGGGGIGAFDFVLLVGGTEIGPRSWVEQVSPRVRNVPVAAIVPTVLQPLAAPYLRTGQLSALLATARDDAAFVELVRADSSVAGREASTVRDLPPPPLALLLGMLLTLAVLGDAVARRLRGQARDDRASA